jgi:hypothetical protein
MAMVAASKFAGKRAAGRRGDASPLGIFCTAHVLVHRVVVHTILPRH